MPRSDSVRHRLPATALDRPLAETARRIVLARLDALDAATDALRDGKPSAETVHRFRVALRRVRSVLRAYRPALDDLPGKSTRRRLDAFAAASGPVRDADVHQAWLDGHEALLPAEALPFVDGVRARLDKEARRGLRRLHRLLDADYRPTVERLRQRCGAFALTYRLGDAIVLPRARDELRPILHALAATLERRLRALETVNDASKLHRARIATKRLRYALEPLADEGLDDAASLVPKTRQVLALLEQLQGRLGEIHDLQAFGARLAAFAAEAAAAAARAEALAETSDETSDATRGDAGDGEPDERGLPGASAGYLERSLRARAAALFADLEATWLGARSTVVPELVRGLTERLAR